MSRKNDKSETEEIDCLVAINELYQYLDGEMDDQDSKERFEHHLSHCKSCYSRIEMEKMLT